MTVLLFALVREAVGTDRLALDLPDGATVSDALDALAAAHPQARALLPVCATALDMEFAPRSTVLPDDATLAVLPPVSGG